MVTQIDSRRYLAGGIAFLLFTSFSPAQNPGATRPAYSPYLNLTRPGGTLVNNYYGLVRPEIEFRGMIGGLQSQYRNLSTEVNNQFAVESQFPTTGHQVSFMNYSHYYNIRGRAVGYGGMAPQANVSPGAGRPNLGARPNTALPPQR